MTSLFAYHTAVEWLVFSFSPSADGKVRPRHLYLYGRSTSQGGRRPEIRQQGAYFVARKPISTSCGHRQNLMA
jgi:hypothetical protein